MNHDERDEKLVHFLRSHRPDIPRESHDFEERLLNATVRRSLSSKLKGMLKINWATTGALCAAVSLTAIIFMRPAERSPTHTSPISMVTHTPLPELSEEEVYFFISESFESVGTPFSSSFDAEFETL